MTSHLVELYGNISNLPITACKQYCLATGATQGNIAYTQTVSGHCKTTPKQTK